MRLIWRWHQTFPLNAEIFPKAKCSICHTMQPMLTRQLVTDWSVMLCVIDFRRESRTDEAIGVNDLDVSHIAVSFSVNFVTVKQFNDISIYRAAIAIAAFGTHLNAAAFIIIENELRTVKLEKHMGSFAVGCKMQTAIAVFKKAISILAIFLILWIFFLEKLQTINTCNKTFLNILKMKRLMDAVFVADLKVAIAIVDKPFFQIFNDEMLFLLCARSKQKQQHREIQNLILHSA